MKEHNNRQKAKQFAEYITGPALRKYLASKVTKYVGEYPTVFDGAVGSGQLEQYIQPNFLHGVEIQKEAVDVCRENYPHSEIVHQSFFAYSSEVQADCVIMNPPFSLKFKDQPEEDKAAIQELFPWKKSGVVDDIFLLKSLQYTKRYAFYIMFPGISYRNTEQKMRQLVGKNLLELNTIHNAFDDTQISVIFLVIDKEKIDSHVEREIYDCKTEKQVYSEPYELGDDFSWEQVRIPQVKEKIDIDKVNQELDELVLKNFESHLASQLMIIMVFSANIDYLGFIQKARDLLTEYELQYNFGYELWRQHEKKIKQNR